MPTKKPGAPAAPKAASKSEKIKGPGKGDKVAAKKGPVGPPPQPVHGLAKVVAAVKSKLKPKKK